MKNTLITLLISILIPISSFAQQGINYKAILKDTNGNVLASTFMNVQFTIHQSTVAGTIVYQEDHNYTTNANGLVVLTIGTDSSPSVGTFTAIDWATGLHFLQTSVTYSGGTINFDATEFKAVPYAKHAKTAEIAANVFSGDYNDLTNQPTTLPTGLEKVTDSIDSGTGLPIYGWRLIGAEPANYGNIGLNAVDISISPEASTGRGAIGINSTAMGSYTTASGIISIAMGDATKASGYSSTAMGNYTTASGAGSTAMGSYTTASGTRSTAMGFNTTASGVASTAMGSDTTASGDFSTAMGYNTTAPSYAETVIGRNNTNYTPDNAIDWDVDDRLFVIGNGLSNSNRNNALTVLKNGTITAPSLTNNLINTAGDKALITKEYADSNYLTESSNLIPLAYGTIEFTGNVLSGTGNFTASINSNVFDISISGEYMTPFNTFCIITPYSTAFRTSSNGMVGGDIQVRIFNSSGSLAPVRFQFVIYKL
ncbi:hypothetical protein A9Q86_03020 [Flavobacteriales bacterium 33_180_T64]|nr:hypothetical protein A9Q86_03020 [Flavobacteriales bacterium 33_180_T64]